MNSDIRKDRDDVQAILDQLKLSGWDVLIGPIDDELKMVLAQSGKKLLRALEIGDESEVFSLIDEAATKFAQRRAAELVGKRVLDDGSIVDNPSAEWAITDGTRELLRGTVNEALENGWSPGELRQQILDHYAFSPQRALNIARTECLPGETPVTAAMVRAAFRRWYEGEMVNIITTKGRKFSATPNHPMLTQRGWLAAGEITNSDYLVCDDRQQDLSANGDQHIHSHPTTIAEVFDALAISRPIERHPGASFDFHGDGRKSNVDIARSDGILHLGFFVALYKPVVDTFLAPANLRQGGVARFCHSCGRLLPVNQGADLGAGSQLDAGVAEPSGDCFGMSEVTFRDLGERGSIGVGGGDLLDGGQIVSGSVSRPDRNASFPSQTEHGVGGHSYTFSNFAGAEAGSVKLQGGLALCERDSGSPDGQSGATDELGDKPPIHSELFGDSVRCEAGTIQLDRVITISRGPFSGHVFNLETPWGYFTIADGLYTGNTARAHSLGGLAAAKDSGVVKTKSWLLGSEHDNDQNDVPDECDDAANDGEIPIDEEFSSGDQAPPNHPNCSCSVIYHTDLGKLLRAHKLE